MIIKEFIQALRDERGTKYLLEWQERNWPTYVTQFLDTDIVQTYEPANIQAMLATQFEDFGLGYRLQSWSPLLGRGIFTTDGAEWFVHPPVRFLKATDQNTGSIDEQSCGLSSREKF